MGKWRMADGGWQTGRSRRRASLIHLPSVIYHLPSAILAVALLLLAGCGGEGYLMHLVSGGDKVPAAFTLAERSTLILVDDPADRFADPNLPLTVALNIEFNLRENGVLKGKVIPARQIADMQARLGDRFNQVPVDQVGRELGADQVLYVLIDDVTIEKLPNVFRPSAQAQVKVIDATTGRRLFPDPPTANQPPADTPVRGHRVLTELRQQTIDVSSQGTLTQMKRRLAETLGRDIARQFYKWKPPEIGSRFDEP